MGSRRKPKPIAPPKIEQPMEAIDPIDVTMSATDYQRAATADDMTMQSTILTKPKRKKKTAEMQTNTLMSGYGS
tara:strand:- start:1045 stop:1266 length:222 start_codon:yes stop_codon:yes gene_type:complete